MDKKIDSNSELIIYQNKDGDIKIDVRLDNETVWLTQEQTAQLLVMVGAQ